jgi:hypothetical protein
MENVNCPFCGVEVSMNEVDKNAGCCPECDALVTGSLPFEDIEVDDLDDLGADLDFDDDDDDLLDKLDEQLDDELEDDGLFVDDDIN